MNGVKTVTHVEDFAIDLSSTDALLCDGVSVDNNVLRSLNKFESIDERADYMGVVGSNSKYLFAYTNKVFRQYDGEAFKNLMVKMPIVNPISADARYDMYRDVVYFAFDQDGIIRHDETAASQSTVRWSFRNAAQDIAVVNERLIMLTEDGMCLRFGESGGRLYADGEQGQYASSINLPGQVQAIHRYDNNTLYALGNTIYKLVFSADERDIKLSTVADGIGKVVLHSVAQIGDKVIFATNGGLFTLRNDNVTPIFTELSKVIRNFDGCRARAWRGKYALIIPYLQGRRGYVLDVNSGKCCALLCHDVVDLCEYGDCDAAVNTNSELVRSVQDEYYCGTFVRANLNFGSARNKFLRKLNISTRYDVEVAITDGKGVKRRYRFNGSDRMQSARIYGKGRAFKVEICPFGQMEITALNITAETYKEE